MKHKLLSDTNKQLISIASKQLLNASIKFHARLDNLRNSDEFKSACIKLSELTKNYLTPIKK